MASQLVQVLEADGGMEMTAKQFKLPLPVRIAIFLICAGFLPIFLIKKAIKKARAKR